ncbi:conserved hypothetical protein [delta proteobacterium NaphS2]|nr:conserved hypothetical protein [delta proteobacterium NaphS2]
MDGSYRQKNRRIKKRDIPGLIFSIRGFFFWRAASLHRNGTERRTGPLTPYRQKTEEEREE